MPQNVPRYARWHMDTNESKLMQSIEMVYGAVETPSLWPLFLTELADAMKGGIAAIYVHDIESSNGNCIWSARVDPRHLHLYNEYYHSKNIWAIRAGPLLVPGRILMSHEVCPDSEVLKTEYYSDFLQPMDVLHNIGATLLRESSRVAMLTVTRSRRSPHFDTSDLVVLRALMPHLKRALQLQRVLSECSIKSAASSDLLDRLQVAVFVVNRDGDVRVLNKAAQKLLDDGDGLTVGPKGLAAQLHNETLALRRLITNSTIARGEEKGSGGSMLITRKFSGWPLEILVTPLRCYVDLFEGKRTSALLLAIDPSAGPRISPEILHRLFGLSGAEANFVRLLASGKNVSEVAGELRISMNTARTHLKKVLMKIGGRRQAEIILRVLRSPAVFDDV
jgi:DNA-binding CsgD family transcriptional regulator/PAS domain-containing protein